MNTSLRARAGLTGFFALACAGLTGIAVAAPASAATPDTTTGAHFLASELATGGDHFSVSSGGSSYPDYGLTIDGILGLDSARTGQAEATRAASYITKNAKSYNSYGDDLYAGSTAKLLVFAQAQGLPADGYLAELKSLEQDTGQFKDKSASDYSNTIGQSLAIVGLTRAGKPDATAVDFLLKQQCNDGGFRMTFTGTACTGDTDATSLAVQALSAAGGHEAEVSKAVAFIAGKQQSNGGVVEPAAQAAPNTNSTGLAAVAFALTGKTSEAAKAKSFVAGLQFGCSSPTALRGGFAFDQKSFDALQAKGSKGTVSDKEHRATTQAMLALTQQPYLKISAGGSAAAPALSCTTSSPSSSATSTASSTTAASTTTGPAIITDGSESGGGNTGVLFAGAAVVGGAALAGSGLRRRLRSRG